MSNQIIISLFYGLEIPSRLKKILSFYLLSLMIPAQKHTLTFAEKISGKANSLFSSLLINHLPLSTQTLNRLSKRRLKKLMKVRNVIVKGAPWTIAIIIDSTLHVRTSQKIENSQKFNHGKGWVTGHQWTNLGVLINGELIPLPPIPFYTSDECEKRSISYKTEHEKIAHWIKTLDLNSLLGPHDSHEIVVLADSGYDSKIIQSAILSRKLDFITAIKATRTIVPLKFEMISISRYFSDGRRPWKTIRLRSDGGKGKQRKYCFKQVNGNLKGLDVQVNIICSKRSDGAIKYFASSRLNLDAKSLIMTYQKRWFIELFHRAIKSYLGLEDVGCHHFNSVHAHVHWVYCSYILLHEICDDPDIGIKSKQEHALARVEVSLVKEVMKRNSQINGDAQIRKLCLAETERIKRMYRL